MLKDLVRSWVVTAFNAAYPEINIELRSFVIERPRLKAHGDVSCNIALAFANDIGTPSREVAEKIREHLLLVSPYVRDVDVAGPGFINFFLNNQWFGLVLSTILNAGHDFGRNHAGNGQKVQIEFVSANPVGPLHVGHGRWAVIGDVLARLLSWNGFSVDREFYINDYGAQVENFALSILHHLQLQKGIKGEFPEQGYRGAYIAELAELYVAERGDDSLQLEQADLLNDIKVWGLDKMLTKIKHTLELTGVRFEKWASETSYYESGKTDEVINLLTERGHTYTKDGAVWLRSTELGDEKDRVLIRANGAPTYFLGDTAYHLDKFERGFDLLINIWGADHHGYVARVHAAMQALGFEQDRLEIIIGQLVNLYRDGEAVRMSKRTGEMVTFDELIEEVGKDAIRYLFARTSPDTAIDFDIELAKKRSAENPIFYIQYAHARICSILQKAADVGHTETFSDAKADLELLVTEHESALVKKLADFEEIVGKAGVRRAPHLIPAYAEELAAMFHSFYAHSKVISDDNALTKARLSLVIAVRTVLSNSLKILGVDAPEKM